MVTPQVDCEITATEAAELALITYRQLDHWAHKRWVTPSVRDASGRGKRRLYSADDVLRLASLRHFARSGWAVGELGEQLADVNLSTARWLVASTGDGLTVAEDSEALFELLSREQQFSLFDLEPLRREIGGRFGTGSSHDRSTPVRRSA